MTTAGTSATAAAAFALVGCGDDDDDDDDGADAPTSSAGSPTSGTAATGSPAAATKVDGGVYVENTLAQWPFNPDLHQEINGNPAYHNSFSNLVVFADVSAGTIVADAAAKLPEQPDQTTYVFKLRPGVKWHNKAPANGRDLTAADVKWNFERQMARKLADGSDSKNFHRFGSVYQFVDSVQATDATTVTVKLKSPNAPWLSAMADQLNGIMYPDVALAIEQNPTTYKAENFVGTGAYVVDAYENEREWKLSRNPDYFRKKAGEQVQFLDGMRGVNLGQDPNALRAAFEQKQIDVFGGFSKAVMEAAADANRNAELVKVGASGTALTVLYNFSKGPFADPRLRKAVDLAIDRHQLLKQNFAGEGKLAPAVPWSFEAWSLPQKELLDMPGYREDKTQDLKDAKALWTEGGGGNLGDLSFVAGEGSPIAGSASGSSEWWPAMLNRNLGTSNIKVRYVPDSSLFNYLISPDYFAHLGGDGAWNQPDPRVRFRTGFGKGGSLNFAGFTTPEMEALLEKAFTEFDRTKAIGIMHDAQRHVRANNGAGQFHMVGTITRYLKWPYLQRNIHIFGNYWSKDLTESTWIDQKATSFSGRRS